MTLHSEPLRVLASPAFRGRKSNPYTWALNTGLLRLGATVEEFKPNRLREHPKPHIWHLHWPEGFLNNRNSAKVLYRLLRLRRLLRLAHANSVKIVWTVHNLRPHERLHPRLEKQYWRLFLPCVDACIHITEHGRRLAHDCYPGLASLPEFVIPLMHYRNVYADTLTRTQARQQLGLPEKARVILFFGQIRRYKKVPELIEIFKRLPDPELRLVVAGSPREQPLREQIEQAGRGDARVQLHLKFIPDEQVQIFLRAANLTVAPYEDILNSATALLSLSFDCPILAPEKGSLPELQASVGPQWVKLYPGRLTPSLLRETVQAVATQKPGRPDLAQFQPEIVARRTFDAFQAVASLQR